jgi:outer membrane protein TolC
MNKKSLPLKLYIASILCFISIVNKVVIAQGNDIKLSLTQVIDLAKQQSPQAKLAATSYKNKYWIYKSYKSNYKPQLRFNGTLPNLTRSYQNIPQNDGSYAFRLRSASSSAANLGLTQNIGFTGGQVFVNSSLERIDIFSNPHSSSYLSSPVVVGINQPLFAYNDLKWQNKIAPLKYEESRKFYNEEIENTAIQAADIFFSLLLAQNNVSIQQKNVTNNDTLFQISKGRYNLGKIAENDLLQMELSVMNARNNLSQAQLDLELGTLQLKTFLKLKDAGNIVLEAPNYIPQFTIDEKKALSEALKNRQQIIGFKRQKYEAESEVARAKGNRLNINLNASYGLTQSAVLLPDAYTSPLEQQSVRFGLDFPIVDWGRANAEIQTAKANKELIDVQVEQAEQNFNQDIYLAVKQVNMYREKLIISGKADTIAQRRYEITIQRYLIGKISIVDLNIAIQEKDMAKREYMSALRNYWTAYYQLRRKTLYDFEASQTIEYIVK